MISAHYPNWPTAITKKSPPAKTSAMPVATTGFSCVRWPITPMTMPEPTSTNDAVSRECRSSGEPGKGRKYPVAG